VLEALALSIGLAVISGAPLVAEAVGKEFEGTAVDVRLELGWIAVWTTLEAVVAPVVAALASWEVEARGGEADVRTLPAIRSAVSPFEFVVAVEVLSGAAETEAEVVVEYVLVMVPISTTSSSGRPALEEPIAIPVLVVLE
jgi:hypothetical protein